MRVQITYNGPLVSYLTYDGPLVSYLTYDGPNSALVY
jgi:hypothetical protein